MVKAGHLLPLLASLSWSLTGCGGEDSPLGESACGEGDVGREEGALVEDFTLQDQDGNAVSLSDYCGQVVYLPMGAMWCPGCVRNAEGIPDLLESYGDDGLVILNLMAENPQGKPPSTSDLTTWATNYDLESPVLSDEDWKVWDRYFEPKATPKSMLIGRDGKLLVVGYVGERDIEGAL